MKKIIYLLAALFILSACSDDFLNRYPKGQWHHGNYTPDNEIDNTVLVEAKLQQAYADLRAWPFCWPSLAMQSYITPDAEKGSTASDGGDAVQFKSMGFTQSNGLIKDFYAGAFGTITKTNESLALIATLADTVQTRDKLTAESIFLRSAIYFRLVQAFGDVPYVDKALGQDDKTPARTPVVEIYSKLEKDLLWCITHLPTRRALVQTGNQGRATQNAARAVLAKIYLYQKQWGNVMKQTGDIIGSGDNDLATPYDQIFTEKNEFGSESVFEVNVEFKPDEKIYLGSQWGQIQGIRGVPNLGWGFNGPSAALMTAYEEGDPRKAATVIGNGDMIEDEKIKADPAGYKFFNRKLYPPKVERGIYGRTMDQQGDWINIRLIRYADIVLMYAEAACESGNIPEALAKLEMIRARARGENSALLPKITTQDLVVLRDKVRQERRIELALEFERYYDLVRWNVAKDLIPNFVVGKHEVFPIPQDEIDKSNGVLTQNPNY